MCQNGDSVPQDSAEAFKWYLKAANQGNALAQNFIAIKYAEGDGVPQDFVMAHKWYNIAGENGQELAVTRRKFLERLMTAEQIAEAQRLAMEWQPAGTRHLLASAK
jgi:hypothetical protein